MKKVKQIYKSNPFFLLHLCYNFNVQRVFDYSINMPQLTAFRAQNKTMNGSTHKGFLLQQGDNRWEGGRNCIFRQLSNLRWKLTSFTVLSFQIRVSIMETAGLAVDAELIGEYTNSWSFFCQQFHQMCHECVCVYFCSVWLVVLGHNGWL